MTLTVNRPNGSDKSQKLAESSQTAVDFHGCRLGVRFHTVTNASECLRIAIDSAKNRSPPKGRIRVVIKVRWIVARESE
jgi:hypothetical protein